MVHGKLSDLVKKYEESTLTGKQLYFDADEFEDLIDHFDSLSDLDSAAELLEIGLKIHPDNYGLLCKKIKMLIYETNFDEAFALINHISSGYDFDLSLMRIECLLQLGSIKEARREVAAVIGAGETEPKDMVFSEIGFLFVDADMYQEAIQYFAKSIELNPSNTDVLSDLTYCHEMLGDFDAAIANCNKALDIDPYSFDTWMNMGKLYSLKEDFENAADAFDFALAVNPKEDKSIKLKAHCLSLCDRVDEAIALFEELIALHPKDFILYLLVAECYDEIGSYQMALDRLKIYVDHEGETEDLLIKKINILLKTENLKEVELNISYGLMKYPKSSELKNLKNTIDSYRF